jgi:hypothetical protein
MRNLRFGSFGHLALVGAWLLLIPACDAPCVDFSITPADLTCSVASDCTYVGSLHLCPKDPSCGEEHPVNVAAAARYARATAGVPLTPVECGAASPVGCVQGQCALVSP